MLIQSLKSTYIKSSCNIDLYLTKYHQLLFLGDFNVGVMINKPPCFKNHDKTSCIDLILTNCPRNLQNSCVVRTGLTDFHKLVVSVLKATYKKSQPKFITYRSYKYFNNDSFREALLEIECNGKNCDENFNFLPLHAILFWMNKPLRKKVTGDQSPFMNKTLSKAIMQRSKPWNIFLQKAAVCWYLVHRQIEA